MFFLMKNYDQRKVHFAESRLSQMSVFNTMFKLHYKGKKNLKKNPGFG